MDQIAEYAISDKTIEEFDAFAAEHYDKFDFEVENLYE